MAAKSKPIGSVHKLPPSGTGVMRSPYKGHTSVKSNAFAATGCTRLVNQYGVMDHLNVHYKKIHTAKSRIDSSTPKSWTTSVKKIDQVKRQGMQKKAKSASRPSSRSSSKASGYNRPDTARSYDRDLTLQDLELVDHLLEDDDDDDIYGQHQRRNASPKQSRHRPKENGLNSTYGANNNQLGYTTTGLSTSRRSNSRLSGTNRPRSGMTTDLLDKRADSFTTPQKEYTPRTLRTNAQSRLAQSKNYNPPKRKAKPKAAEEDAYSSFSEEDIELPHDQTGNDEYGEPHIPNSPTEDETNDAVAYWVSKHSKPTPHLKNTGKEFNTTLGDIQEGHVLNQSQNSYTLQRNRTMEMTPRRFSRKMEEQEEELRYLEFVTDVTNDVLNRGIFTNRVLKQVFETHIQLHKQQLDEARMRDLMQQLQRDLQIPDDDDNDDDDDER
ncbi:spermatogenesis-associated protein 7 homolog [Amphiura filiformis]|uniref:spermatogenesis-associated protein 7 homolog n=1 Tax=Amphiura filiformis TaxID=82378 RepID=UPI003B2200A9